MSRIKNNYFTLIIVFSKYCVNDAGENNIYVEWKNIPVNNVYIKFSDRYIGISN